MVAPEAKLSHRGLGKHSMLRITAKKVRLLGYPGWEEEMLVDASRLAPKPFELHGAGAFRQLIRDGFERV